MAKSLRQSQAAYQSYIDGIFLTGTPDNISAAKIREAKEQERINDQPVDARVTLAGVTETVTLNNATFTKVPAGTPGGVSSSQPSLFDGSTVEITASDVTDDLTFNFDCRVMIAGSILIEPPGSSSLITVDIVWYDASSATEFPLGFQIEAVQQAGKGTMLTIPSFPFTFGAGDKLWLIADTDNGSPELCDVKQAYLGACMIPYGV